MIKSELVARIAAQNPHLYNRDVERVVNAILNQIVSAMKQGNRVELRGFGAFSVRIRRARTGRNPRNGSAVQVAEKVMPYFKPGKEMLGRLNVIATGTKASDSLRATSMHGLLYSPGQRPRPVCDSCYGGDADEGLDAAGHLPRTDAERTTTSPLFL
jgi:integration host factor subunit beta